MLAHKIADDPEKEDHVANFMKEIMEQTKLQKTVYSKDDAKGKGNCLLISPGKLKEEKDVNGVTPG